MKIFTGTVVNGSPLVISSANSVMQISIMMQSSSSATLLGTQAVGSRQPSAITLTDGQGVTLTAANANSPLDGLTLTVSSGTADVVMSLNL